MPQDKILDFYKNVVEPLGHFKDADEFRSIMTDGASANDYFENSLKPMGVFKTADEFNQFFFSNGQTGTPQPKTTSQPTGVITQPLAQGSQQGTQPPAFEVEYGTSGFSQGLGGLSVGQQRLSQEKLAPIQEKETKELEARQKENDIKLQVNNIVDKNKNQFDQEINAKKAEYELKVKEIQSLQNKDSQQFEAFNKQIEDISSGFDLYQNQQAELYKNDIERRKQDVELRIEQINSREYKNQNEVDLANKTIESIVKDFENYQNTRYSEFEQNINNRYAEIQTATQEINNQQIQIQQNFETTNNRLQQLTNEFNDWQNQRAQQLNEKVNTEIGDFYSKQIKPQEKETRISQSLSAIKSMRKEQIDNQIKDYGIPIIPETTQVPKKSRIVTKDVVVPDQSVIVEKYIKENQSYLPKSESENLQEVAIGVGINKFNEYMKSLSEEEKSKLSVAEIEMLKSRYVDNEARAIQGDIKQMLLAQIPKEKQTTENLKRIEQDLWDNYRFGIDLSGDNEWNEKNSIQDGAVSFFVGASQLGGQILYLGATLNPFLNITGVSDDIKGWVESVNEKSKNILQEYTSQSGSMLESLKTGNYLTFAKQSLSTLASSAPAMILSGATGNPYLGYAALSLTSGTQTYLDVKDEEFFKELSDAGKVGYVGSIGAIEGLSELVGAKILGGMVDDMIKGLATPKTKKEFLNWFIGTAKANGINITADAATEMLPSVTQYLADSLAKGEKITFDGIKENALEGFLGGFGMVGVTSTVTTGLPAAAYFANVVKQDKLNKKIIKLNKEYSNSESKEERKIIAEQIINTRLELNKSLLNADKLYKRFSLVDKTSYSYRMAQLDQAIAVSEKLQQGTTAYEIQKEKIDNLYKEITAIEEKYAQQEEQKTPVVEKMSSKTGEILDTEKPQPTKVTVLGKEVNQYNNYIPEKTEDVEEDAIYTFTSDNKEGIPEVLREKANVNKADIEVKNKAGETVRTEKKESWSASINGKELIDLFEQQKTQQEQKTDETAKQEEPMLEGVQATRDETKVGQESAELRTEEATQKEVVEPLKDVESTSKALEGKTDKIKPKVYSPKNKRIVSFNIDNEGVLNRIKSTPVFNTIFSKSQIDKLKIGNNTVELNMTAWGKAERMLNATDETNSPKTISEAYHKAKKDGSNPELVKAVEDLLTPKTTKSDTQDKAGIPSKEQKGQEPKQAKPKQEASGEKAETGRDVQTPKEKGRVTPDKTKEEVRVEPDEKEVKEVAEKAGITPKNLKDLYKIGRDMFGLNKVQAFAQAVVMDRNVGVMARNAVKYKENGKIKIAPFWKRDAEGNVFVNVGTVNNPKPKKVSEPIKIGVSKSDIYKTLEFRKGDKDTFKTLSAKGKALYQIVGENAQLAENIRLNLNVAREMEADGRTPKEIRIATGWEKGADDKWKYEIGDGKLRPRFTSAKNLYEAISNKGLFELYPELADIKVSFKEEGSGASYNRDKKTITIFGTGVSTNEEIFSSILHETQHAIQQIEGFARGGNAYLVTTIKNIPQKSAERITEMAASGKKSQLEKLDPIDAVNKEISDTEKNIKTFFEKSKAFFASKGDKTSTFKYDKFGGLLAKLSPNTLSVNVTQEQKQILESINADKNLSQSQKNDAIDILVNNKNPRTFLNEQAKGLVKKRENIKAAMKAVDEMYSKTYPEILDGLSENEKETVKIAVYKMLAGEVEARNVQARMGMTEQQRRETTLQETEDVARDEQIVLFDEGQIPQGVKFQASSLKQEATSIWKSTAKEGISKIQQKAATPEQWVKMISDKGGRGTIQELEWIGLQDFLTDYAKENNLKSVPKEVVEQYIADNQIEIVDVSKGDLTPKEIQKRDNIQEKINRIGEKIVVARLNGNEELVLQLENEQEQLFDELKPLSDLTNRTVTRYSQYTLEGGENYREVLLTLPNNKKSDQKFYKKQHFDEANILAHLRLNERTLPNGERVLFIEEVQSDWAQEGKKKGFGKREKITENDIEIISDEKEYYDSEMMGYDHRVKFRVKGFDDIDSVTYNDGLNSKERSIIDLKKRLVNDYNRELLQEGRTPDMPYKKTDQWVGMAMRRAMQMAAQEGFDRIAWVTGEQSADRYSLKEKVNSISVAPNESGRFVFIDMKGNYDVTLNVDDNGKIIEDKNNLSGQQSFKGKQLEDVVGKDMADKILSQKEENKFEGQGLEVGGEGMKAFYNSILPKVAKKEAQRFDKNAKVEVADFGGVSDAEHAENIKKVGVYNRIVAEENNFMDELNVLKPTEEQRKQYEGILKRKEEARKNLPKQAIVGEQGRGMADYPLENNTPSKQLSIAITPKMRMNLNGAVPLFQGEQGAMLAEDGKYIIYALTDPNVSTPLHELAHVFEHYLTEAERTSVLKWAGATEWTTEVSEKFARGFEKYLADGKAPTVSLQKIFNRFKEWLTDIYNGIVGSDIDIQLNDEMRDLYGKMLGVDAVKEQEKKSFANIIRGLKIDTTGKAFDATLGLPVAIYNNAIEITAKAVEAGVEVKKAIQKGIDYANKKMNGKKWDVEGFRNQLLTTIKGQFEQQAAQMRSSEKEVKTPKTRFLGFLTRSGAKIVNANDYIDSMKTNMNLDVSDTKKRIDDAKSKARKVFAKTNKIKNDKEVANIVNDLLNRIISPDEYNMTAQEAIDKIRKDIKNPKVAQELIDAGLDIRTQIDNMTKFMLENAEKFNLSDEAIENLKSNIGNYIHREYMFFSERGKTFRKQSLKTRRLEKWNPTDEMINEAIAEHAIYNGISVDEAKKQIEDLIEDWKKKRTPIKVTGNNVIRIQDVKVEADLMKGRVRIPQNFTLFSEASKEAEKELQKKGIDSKNKNYNTLLSVETERIYKDKGGEYVELPPHLRKLLGEERNATQRYINTMLAMSNMVYKAQAMDMIVKSFDGKDGWIYDKEPANNEGDYKLVNDKYSPLNGKWVNIYLIEEFNKLPIYETDLAIAKAYFEYQSLVRTTKTVANSPTNFKNVIGGIFAQMQNGFFIALTNPKLAALSIYSRGHLYFKGRRNELAKQVLKDGAEAGVLSSSVDVEVLGLKGSILSERVKFGKSELGRRYAQQDDWTKSLMVYLYKQDVSLMLFGKKFDDLSKDQQKEVLIKTGSLTKKGVPTFSNLPSWFRTISRLPTGDFMSFTVEATRSLIGSGIIAYEHARAASTGVDSKGNTINETQRRAYAKDAAKRIAGLVAIQSVGKAIGAGAFSLGGSAIEYGSQVFAAIFGGGDDEDENDETKLAKIQVVKEINKTIPDWAVGDRVIVTNVDDDGNVTFYNWTGLEPSSETAQLIGGNFKYFEQFYKGSITAKMLIQLYNNENEIGNEIYLEDEPLYKQVFNSAYFLGKNTLLPPFINSTEYEIKRRKEDDENFGVISQDNTVEENAQSAKELTQVFLSRATIRSYNYNIYNRVKQIAYAQSRHGRVDNLDNIKDEEQIDLRLKNISVIRDAYQICLKHRITTPDSPAKIKKISELNDAVKRNYTDFEEAMIYETDDAKFKEMYDFVMSKSKDIVEYNKLKDERKK